MDDRVIDGRRLRVLPGGKSRPFLGASARVPPQPLRNLDKKEGGFSQLLLILSCIFVGAFGAFWCWLHSGPSAALHLMPLGNVVQWLFLAVSTTVLTYVWLRRI